MSHSTETTIDIDVPVEDAYRRWASLENLPSILSVVDEIRTGDGEVSYWKLSIGPVTREFEARVTEVIPDSRIAWKSITGPHHAGVVTFHRIDEHRCRVGLQMEFDPEGVAETVAAALQIVDSAIEYDLGAFKATLEQEHGIDHAEERYTPEQH